jgi:hypothetical protein
VGEKPFSEEEFAGSALGDKDSEKKKRYAILGL